MRWTMMGLLCTGLGWAATGWAQAPPVYFRSDGGQGVGTAALPADLDPQATQVWRCPLPSGHSTPCLYGDRIFVTTFDPSNEQLATVAIDRATGQILGQQIAPRREIESFHQVGSPAAATPACDGQRVYVFFGSYGLLTYDLDGNPGWSRSLGPFQDEFGSASSPALVDDVVWSYAKGVPYVASPLYHEGVLYLVKDGGIFTSLNAATGEVIKQARLAGRGNDYASPVVADGKVYVASEQGVVSVVSAQADWRTLATRDFGEAIYATPIVQDGRLYLRTAAALYCFGP